MPLPSSVRIARCCALYTPRNLLGESDETVNTDTVMRLLTTIRHSAADHRICCAAFTARTFQRYNTIWVIRNTGRWEQKDPTDVNNRRCLMGSEVRGKWGRWTTIIYELHGLGYLLTNIHTELKSSTGNASLMMPHWMLRLCARISTPNLYRVTCTPSDSYR